MRLIDADWVLEHTKPYELSDEDWSITGGTAIRLIHNAIDNAPNIDAVPVVRCKDCKHAWIHPCGYVYCHRDGRSAYEMIFNLDSFCSYGERQVLKMAEYIEREAAIRFLLNDSPEQVNYSREDAADCIRYMDAADVAPVLHGRWVASHDEFCQCSLCKYPVYAAWNTTNYCPNCGAKMDFE